MIWKILGSMIAGAATFVLGSVSMAATPPISTAGCSYQTFKVTAYYSPLPGQQYYYRGNHRDEVILNGRGTHGASGRAVFNGMLAAPPNFAFGTKIYFPGRGVGQVEDRGGAIVEKGMRADATQTRIDIRAGRGEEGLQRALSFGVQYLDGWVCPPGVSSAAVGIDYSVFPQYEDFFHASLWVLSLWPDREDPWVAALQNYLIALGYMGTGRSTGYYGRETKAAVCKYQQDYMAISGSSSWCGYFGPQTRYDMKMRLKKMGISNLYGPVGSIIHNSPTTEDTPTQIDVVVNNAGEIPLDQPPKTTVFSEHINNVPKTLNEQIIAQLFTKGEFALYSFDEDMKKGTTGKAVRILQRKLQWLGFLPSETEISGIYDAATIAAMYEFQLASGVLNKDAPLAVRGYFGPKTRSMMNAL